MQAPHCGAARVQQPCVAEVLRRFLPTTPLPGAPHIRKVLTRLSRCHTGQLGWTLWQCDHCSRAHWRPSGCGDRHCPDCSSRAREQWINQQRSALLPVRYFHWVFTLPAELRMLALQNQAVIYTLLFDAAAQTLLQFGAERFQAQFGITALLHTWGQNLTDHPHLHCLVPGGGLRCVDGAPPQWIAPQKSRYLFPVKAVARMFMGKFIDGLRQLRDENQLLFEGQLREWIDPTAWQHFLATLWKVRWNVFAKGSVVGPESILDYFGRYTHRVAISNGRIVRMDSNTVSFRYKDYRDGDALKEMTLEGSEFVRRFALHILPVGFTKIRHYGILGNNRRAKLLPLARAALEKSPARRETAAVKRAEKPPPPSMSCPACEGTDLQCVGRIDAIGKFTGLQRGATLLFIRVGLPPSINDSS